MFRILAVSALLALSTQTHAQTTSPFTTGGQTRTTIQIDTTPSIEEREAMIANANAARIRAQNGRPVEPTAQTALPIDQQIQAPARVWNDLNAVANARKTITFTGQPIQAFLDPKAATVIQFPQEHEIALISSGDTTFFSIAKPAPNIVTVQPKPGAFATDTVVNVVTTNDVLYTLLLTVTDETMPTPPDLVVQIVLPEPEPEPEPTQDANADWNSAFTGDFAMQQMTAAQQGAFVWPMSDRLIQQPGGAQLVRMTDENGAEFWVNPLSPVNVQRQLMQSMVTARPTAEGLTQWAAFIGTKQPNTSPMQANYLRDIADGRIRLDVRYAMSAPRGTNTEGVSPISIATDGTFTYFNYGSKFNSIDLPVVMEVSNGVETPINTRVIGTMLVAETASRSFVLRGGSGHVCINRLHSL